MGRLTFLLNQFGFSPSRLLRAIRGIPVYILNLARFGWRPDLTPMPCLGDRYEQAGSQGEYFYVDLFMARAVFERVGVGGRHIDVGSRIDGFVSHLATFRALEVIDIRPLQLCSSVSDRISFVQADLLSLYRDNDLIGQADSVSSVHALEHFGLGRYGDQVDPEGNWKALTSLSRLVRPGGFLFVAMPVGCRARIFFDAHRVVLPDQVIAKVGEHFSLRELTLIDPVGSRLDATTSRRCDANYSVGCFIFQRTSANSANTALA